MPYDPSVIEPKWQKFWEDHRTFETPRTPGDRPKYYILDMFPYPSGAGLHVGHGEGYTATDILARWKRMCGYAVLHPMGWDAFGLPAERAAVREGIHPAIITKRNTDNFRRQIKRLGFSYDWSREVDTSHADYYRWTQWIFLRLHERGLAYRADVAVNWCPALGTVLANEEVSPEGTYKETGDPVERRLMKQWMLRITSYAERLVEDLELVDWPEPVKKMQREWIGRSEGAHIRFALEKGEGAIEVFTTRPDTLLGVTYCVVAPEHPLLARLTTPAQSASVQRYVEKTQRKSDRDRRADSKEKSGVFTGSSVIHPLTGAKIPVWTADYVIGSYGTGAVMAVPAHDQRDFEFAQAHSLPVVIVVRPEGRELSPPLDRAFEDDGVAVASGAYSGLKSEEFRRRVTADLTAAGRGEKKVSYALRDWLFSRQRYWGEPFPLVIDASGEAIPLPDDALPVELPHLEEFRPTDDGRPPLARATEWLRTEVPKTKAPAERETNTMPQWAGSCWYYLRFLDPKNDRMPFDPAVEKAWMPVDLYVGGVEHAVLHLLYARFWHKVLYDLGIVSTKEPFQRLFNQGMILAPSYQDAQGRYWHESAIETGPDGLRTTDGHLPVKSQVEKMSKSMLNVVSPDDVIAAHGADAMRLYEMFMGPLDATKPWQTSGIEGVYRFLQRGWRLMFTGDDDRLAEEVKDVAPEASARRFLARTVSGVTEDLKHLRFNTAIAKLMELVNELNQAPVRPLSTMRTFVLLVAPFAPHWAEEVWAKLGGKTTLAYEPWPTFDPADLVETEVELPICVNGKVKGRIMVGKTADEAQVVAKALADPNLLRILAGATPKKVIFVPNKMVNIVV